MAEVDGLGCVGVIRGGARLEGGIGFEAFDLGRIGPLGDALGTGGRVEGDLAVGDLRAIDVEEAEADSGWAPV